MAGTPGLRELKKVRTRRHIAETAATLFAERGFDQVSVADVARAAEVSEQTIYNYFSTKHDLVLDRADEIRHELIRLVAERPHGQSPADSLRHAAHQYSDLMRRTSAAQLLGELPVIAAGSDIIRRLLLESRDQTAEGMAAAIVDTLDGVHPAVARAHATALVSVFQMIVDHIGHRVIDGAATTAVADELDPAIDAVLDDLALHFDTIRRGSTHAIT